MTDKKLESFVEIFKGDTPKEAQRKANDYAVKNKCIITSANLNFVYDTKCDVYHKYYLTVVFQKSK